MTKLAHIYFYGIPFCTVYHDIVRASTPLIPERWTNSNPKQPVYSWLWFRLVFFTVKGGTN